MEVENQGRRIVDSHVGSIDSKKEERVEETTEIRFHWTAVLVCAKNGQRMHI